MANWIRKTQLTVGGMTFVGGTVQQTLRTTFNIKQRTTQSPGVLDAKVYNVSRTTQQAILSMPEGTPVSFFAGYVNGLYGQIFKGTLRQARVGKDSPVDSFINVLAADEQGYNWGTINRTLPRGSSGSDIFDALAQSMAPYGVTVGYKPTQALQSLKYARGITMFGPAKEYLRSLSHSINATWSIQQTKLQMVPSGDSVPGGPWQVNVNTGMIGMPVQTLQGIVVRSLINPDIGVNQLIQLNNGDIQTATYDLSLNGQINNQLLPGLDPSGLYRVLMIERFGDTRGDPFYADMWCIASNSKPGPAQLEQSTSADSNTYLGKD